MIKAKYSTHLKKYIALYQLTPGDNQICKIVSLGNLHDFVKPVITTSTYGFKIFHSELGLSDVSINFFSSEECKSSVMHYIGKEFNFDIYTENHKYLPTYVTENPKLFNKVIEPVTIDLRSVDPVFLVNGTNYRVICPCKIKNLDFEIISTEELNEKYQLHSVIYM